MSEAESKAALARAVRGDFVGAPRHLAPPGVPEGPFQLALRALCALTAPERFALPTRAELAIHGDHPGAAAARRQITLLSLLELRAPPHVPDDDDGCLAAAITAWLQGDGALAEERAGTALRVSRDTNDAALRVDAESISALAATSREQGVARARRASRMARAEGLLQQEYLANVALARARRLGGRAHLALRILTSLYAVVPTPWRRWIEIEITLAGGTIPGSVTQGGSAMAIGIAAAAGDRAGFDQRAAALREAVAAHAPLRREVAVYLAMLDPAADLPDEALPWASGLSDEAPFGLRDARVGERRVTFALSRPDSAPRRIFGAGLGLAGDVAVVRSERRGTRTEEALSRLVLEGDGQGERDFFGDVYGFAHAGTEHDEVLRGLVHRMRATLGEAGTVVRADGRLRLEAARALATPDPRCAEPLAEQVLDRLAAARGRSTAKEVAAALRVPLRTVQRALGQLVDDGACHAEPDGRRTEYVVEDTTFNEPSLHRLRGKHGDANG